MKIDPEQVLQNHRPLVAQGAWRRASALIAAAIAGIVLIYHETAASIVRLWTSSETFAHGYAIVPIVLYLIWRNRHALALIGPRHDYAGFLLLALAGFGWLVAAAAQVQVLQQYAVTAMIPAVVVALAGRRAAMAIAFPLAFLFLGVPFGEAFLPRLMDWTAEFTVGALRLSGIPVYREGNFFTIPSGQWSVVEACSGLRYLIASLTVGALFAYLNYQRMWKRVLFVALAIVVPIVANFLRAYMIVMIGHLSNMKLAVGVDHFLYGWVFFGIVIGLLFWLGSFWRDAVPSIEQEATRELHGYPVSSAASVALGVGVLAAVGVWPLYAAHLDSVAGGRGPVLLANPQPESGWMIDPAATLDWRPRYIGAAASSFEVYRKDGRAVALYIGYYRNQRAGAELVNSINRVDPPSWRNVGAASRTETFGEAVELRETHLRSGSTRLLVWEWYRIGRTELINPYIAKAVLARDRLLGRSDDSAVIIVAAQYDERPELAAETLREFGRQMRPALLAALAAATLGNSR